jgi:diadenosine tetraphosphate (Ap4A) HIT family hydrolase
MNSAAAPACEAAFRLDPQLARDTLALGDLPLSRALLMNDANFPWLILVPRRPGTVEIFDLDEDARAQLMREITQVAQRLKALTGCHKVNIAAIGNVVPQLHVHIIARRRDDPVWPRPVFGAMPARVYEEAERKALAERLRRQLDLG